MRAHHTDLFVFDNDRLAGDILLKDGSSRLAYNEYAVFKVQNPPDDQHTLASQSGTHESRSIHSETEDEASQMFNSSIRGTHSLGTDGKFEPHATPDPNLEGRVRQIICRRRGEPGSEGLSITDDDFEDLRLHPSTLQHVRRTTTEAMFWDQGHEKLSKSFPELLTPQTYQQRLMDQPIAQGLILAFSGNPRPPYDFLSMTYDIPKRCLTVLVRQSFDPHHHGVNDLDDYEKRMKACENHWAHPFILPVILLQVQLNLAEQHVAMNGVELSKLERDIGNMAGFMAGDEKRRRPSTGDDHSGPLNTTQLMKNAHQVLRKSIELLDTIRWLERAIETLVKAGDELERKMAGPEGPPPSPVSPMPMWAQMPRLTVEGADFTDFKGFRHPLASHWHEIKQYLDSLDRVCKSVGTERSMLETRCRAQIDIIYAKMAQEDNILNARMAVASTRDSSSMKALAVITAIFLPGEYIGTLFGISMFDWDGNGGDDDDKPSTAPSPLLPGKRHPLVSNIFWLYWAIVVPLTIFIITAWRVWWVGQDRFFRKHLSRELSEERYWTDNGRPRELDHSFLHDFFYLSVRRDERAPEEKPPQLSRSTSFFHRTRTLSNSKDDSSGFGDLPRAHTGIVLPRRRPRNGSGGVSERGSGGRFQQISFARQSSRRMTGSAMV